MLNDFITIDRNFQRSMRLDQDYSSTKTEAIARYVPQSTSTNILEMMAEHVLNSKQRAFTWTGPYGSGKSSLALMLCSLVGGGKAREMALERLSLPENDPIISVFGTGKPWQVFALTGQPSQMANDVASILGCKAKTSSQVTQTLSQLADNVSDDSGILLIIDELGKYLEADCASENAYLLQELAETASRSGKRILIVGILHQAVDVYASNMPQQLRDEWEKVKGRFVDMPLLAGTDEVIELLGRALQVKNRPENPLFNNAVSVASSDFASRRSTNPGRLPELLQNCWPLSPVTSLLLGPISRRKFAQNERSIYSFLSSRERFGFREFIESHDEREVYSLANYWDYLEANFETSILSTADGNRWMAAWDAIERTSRKGTDDHLALAKALGLIDLFRNGSGIEATLPILAAATMKTVEATQSLLQDLIHWKIAIPRHHVNAYAIFAGSDFDIEKELADVVSKQTGIDALMIENLLSLSPVMARSVYMRLGTMRWFRRVILPEEQIDRWLNEKRLDDGSTGAFVLVLPQNSNDANLEQSLKRIQPRFEEVATPDFSLVLGIPEQGALVRTLLIELQALHEIAKRPELEGDRVGRNMVAARTSQTRDLLIAALNDTFTHALWQYKDHAPKLVARQRGLNEIANQVSESVYKAVPIIQNELVNRDFLSTNIAKARRQLMYRMLNNETEENLGYTSFPPDYALFRCLFSSIRKKDSNGLWRFDTSEDNEQYQKFWQLTEEFLTGRPMTTMAQLYAYWRRAPFGLRHGPMPLLALAFYLANRERVALYNNTVFTPSLTTTEIDEWLNDPSRIAIRVVSNNAKNQLLVDELAKCLPKYAGKNLGHSPLDVARMIVKIFFESPKWAQHSTKHSKNTQKFKQTAMKASDPVKLLFQDLTAIFGISEPVALAKAVDQSLQEYLAAMPEMIDETRTLLFKALHADPANIEEINLRGAAVKGKSGNMALDAFIARLEKFKNTRFDIEGFISLACAKPPFQWTDSDILIAHTKLVQLAYEFRQLEATASIRGCKAHQRTFALVFASEETNQKHNLQLSTAEDQKARMAAEKIRHLLEGENREVALAALVDAGLLILEQAE